VRIFSLNILDIPVYDNTVYTSDTNQILQITFNEYQNDCNDCNDAESKVCKLLKNFNLYGNFFKCSRNVITFVIESCNYNTIIIN
jgi:hypothetical protein